MEKIALVKVREPKERNALIPISNSKKPIIPQTFIHNWQKLLNIVAELLEVPSALIMKIHLSQIEVFMKDQGKENPYEVKETAILGDGLYCETVLGNRAPLEVPNSLEDPIWQHNPDIELNMISYYGLPISWPDSELFGTICVLDSKTRRLSPLQKQFMDTIRTIIQKDLDITSSYEIIKKELSDQQRITKEMVHRVKNNFNSLLNYCELFSIQRENIHEIADKLQSKLHNFYAIFEQLTYKTTTDTFDLKSYIETLMLLLLKTAPGTNIEPNILGSTKEISPEIASLIGQILTELTTNTLKHAYSEDSNKRVISLLLAISDEEILSITYKDNGIGYTPSNLSSDNYSIGVQILISIVESMQGSICFKPGEGGEVVLTLPLS